MSDPRQVGRLDNLSADFWHRRGDISMLQYKDVYPDHEVFKTSAAAVVGRGIFARMVNRLGIDQYVDHFRDGVIPTGYAWITDVTFNGAPTVWAWRWFYSFAGGHTLNEPHFCANTISAVDLTAVKMAMRCRASYEIQFGLRIDDGTDNNYAEVILDPDQIGNYRVDFRYRTGGGGVFDIFGPEHAATEYVVIELDWDEGTPNSALGFAIGEEGFRMQPNAFTAGAIVWYPTRIGFIVRQNQVNTYDVVFADWFYEETTYS